jgi:hypothetical protein
MQPKSPNDPRSPETITEDLARADEFAQRGTLKHYLLRRGFMPDDEEVAEKILDSILDDYADRRDY